MSTVLEEAYDLVYGPREHDYGHPMDDFSRTARMLNGLWQDKLSRELTPDDVAMAMICVKLSREQNRPSRDNAVDIAGYAATLARVRDRQGRYAEPSRESSNSGEPIVALDPVMVGVVTGGGSAGQAASPAPGKRSGPRLPLRILKRGGRSAD